MEIDRLLHYEATKRTTRDGPLAKSISWIKKYPKGMITRVQEFEDTLQSLNQAIEHPDKYSIDYSNVKAYTVVAGQSEAVLTLSDFALMYQTYMKDGDYEFTAQKIDTFLDKLNHEPQSNNKIQLNHNQPPLQLTSNILIQGYATFLEELYEIPGLSKKFISAFNEVLSITQPDSRLLRDIQLGNETHAPNELDELTSYINLRIKKGDQVHKLLKQIRKFPKPIAVDFNNVITNNSGELSLNPDAPQFINDLRKIGNIFIVTGAPSWEGVYQFLRKNNVWFSDMIIFPCTSYSFITNYHKVKSHGKQIRDEYLITASQMGLSYKAEELLGYSDDKKIAPIFNKPWLVPIIDDLYSPTNNNPGMLGIQVKTWEPNLSDWEIKANENKYSLKQAVQIVKDHYSSVHIENER